MDVTRKRMKGRPKRRWMDSGLRGVCGSAVVPPLWRLGGFGAVMFGNTAELGGQGFQ